MSANGFPTAEEIEAIRTVFAAAFPYTAPKRRKARARRAVLVTAARSALANAWELGYRGPPVLEVATEKTIEEGSPPLNRLPNGDRIWRVDGLAVRTRKLERTADGRLRLFIVGVARAPHNPQRRPT